MFGAGFIQERDYPWPSLAILANILEDEEVLGFGPAAVLLVLVQVV